MTGSANRARLVLFGALLLAGFCLWQLAETASEFFADKALAEQKYTRCLEKMHQCLHQFFIKQYLKIDPQSEQNHFRDKNA